MTSVLQHVKLHDKMLIIVTNVNDSGSMTLLASSIKMEITRSSYAHPTSNYETHYHYVLHELACTSDMKESENGS